MSQAVAEVPASLPVAITTLASQYVSCMERWMEMEDGNEKKKTLGIIIDGYTNKIKQHCDQAELDFDTVMQQVKSRLGKGSGMALD